MRLSFTTFLLTLLISSFIQPATSQQLSVPDTTGQNCQVIGIPVRASGFPGNTGAVEFYIPIDTNVLDFINYTPGTLINVLVNLNSSQELAVSWSNPIGLDPDGILLTLNFIYRGGTTDLVIVGEDFATVLFQPITPTFVDGSVSPLPLLTYYVDGAVAASGNGLSWGTALKKISEATNKPLKGGETVLIKPGTYNDTLVIKSNGNEIVPLKFNVSVSDTNKITFPSGTDLGCMDLAGYPGKYYAYLFRSWKGNNGVYKITGVNKAARYVIVEGAEFVSESGAANDSSMLQAVIGMPVVYQKFSSNPQAERVIVNASGITGERAAVHIGKPTSAGEFNVNAANYNIIDGIDVTGTDQMGVRIQNSKYNVYQNSRVYELDSIAFHVSGNTSKPANNNFIRGNVIYNVSQKALKIGIQSQTSANNRANLNHFKDNEVFSSGAGAYINYINAVDICRYTGYTVIEGNTFRNFKLKNTNRGAIEIKNNVRRVLAYSNFIKNIDRVNPGNYGVFYLQNLGNNNKVYNNVIVDSAAVDNDVFAFWINGGTSGYIAGLVAYNTVHKVDNGFKLESGTSSVDFVLKNNIMNIDATAPSQFFTTGTGLFNVSYNCYSTTPGSYASETGRLVGSPSFLQPTNYQTPYALSLLTGSICLNSGNPVSGVTSDMRKSTRNTTTPSRGAIENVITGIYWTGAENTNWHNYRNWDIRMVPLTTYNVIVPDRPNDPVIGDANVTIKSLQLINGAGFRVNGPRTFTVTN